MRLAHDGHHSNLHIGADRNSYQMEYVHITSEQHQFNTYLTLNNNFYFQFLLREFKGYGHSVDNTVEENTSVFSLIGMHWLPSARTCGH